jgi:hypothetical protein
VLFTSKDCKIKSVNSRQMVAKSIRTENNVYLLKENREECHLRKHDESWLWHRRLGHLKFDHLIKLKNLEAVKDILRISKPQESMCKPCQVGKQNRTRFKSKRFTSIEKPLQLVHITTIAQGDHAFSLTLMSKGEKRIRVPLLPSIPKGEIVVNV